MGYNQVSLGADRKQPSRYRVLWLTAQHGKRSPLTNYRSPFTQGKHFPFHRDQSETAKGSSSEPPLPSWLSKVSRHAVGRTPHLWAPRLATAPCHSQRRLGCTAVGAGARAHVGWSRALTGQLFMLRGVPLHRLICVWELSSPG